MLTGGKLGAIPEAYPLVRAARYLGVPPWELQQQPVIWQQWALIFEAAEDGARQGPQTGGSPPGAPAPDDPGNPTMLGNH